MHPIYNHHHLQSYLLHLCVGTESWSSVYSYSLPYVGNHANGKLYTGFNIFIIVWLRTFHWCVVMTFLTYDYLDELDGSSACNDFTCLFVPVFEWLHTHNSNLKFHSFVLESVDGKQKNGTFARLVLNTFWSVQCGLWSVRHGRSGVFSLRFFVFSSP